MIYMCHKDSYCALCSITITFFIPFPIRFQFFYPPFPYFRNFQFFILIPKPYLHCPRFMLPPTPSLFTHIDFPAFFRQMPQLLTAPVDTKKNTFRFVLTLCHLSQTLDASESDGLSVSETFFCSSLRYVTCFFFHSLDEKEK